MFKNFVLIIVLLGLYSCNKNNNHIRLFATVDAKHSGINFSNTITVNDSINIIDFQYCYNGGGVGIGDFNNDNMPDIVFTGNQVSSKLYINLGELQFKDVTNTSGFKTTSWVTGVSIVDINSDGWDDIYLNVGGPNCSNDCKNLLFINKGLNEDGDITFEENAKNYGLDDGDYAQQTVFFDYDQDDDLDAFIVHNGNSKFSKNTPAPKRYLPNILKDKLLKNDFNSEKNHPYFTDVSEKEGINSKGFGLGVGITDFNNDGKVDVYVANDFITDDLLYINANNSETLNATFIEKSDSYLAHETYNAMGVDIADVNNDALVDILVLDMLPYNYERQKKMLGVMNYDKYLLSKKNNYSSQYMHNTLQVHNGNINGKALKFSEVGFQKGISSTDWSWAPLMIDLDNDADKDILITNGYAKDITDLDFVNFSEQNTVFGTPESRQKKLKELVSEIPEVKLPNFIYEQKDNFTFTDVSGQWTDSVPTLSNGAAYADLDLDGDLDLIFNNINAGATILENLSNTTNSKYLRIKLKGNKKNKHAIGAKVVLWSDGNPQYQFQSVIRGYLSSVEPVLHFGLKNSLVDSLCVTWPNGKKSKLENIESNQVLVFNEEQSHQGSIEKSNNNNYFFKPISNLINLKHKENNTNDYESQHLLPKQHSQFGPSIAVANINYSEGSEIFVGGSRSIPGKIWSQNHEGFYKPTQILDSIYEDSDAVFFDADNDSDFDLYVASSSDKAQESKQLLQDRLYINDGTGNFVLDSSRLPERLTSTSIIKPFDYDNDGDMDLFVGSRSTVGDYPNSPDNYLLINSNGFFNKIEPVLLFSGIVNDATWQDIDRDGNQDLIVIGDWMPIKVFKNNNGKLEPADYKFVDENLKNISTEGWWNSIGAGDFDNDGDIDFLLGNQGINGFIKPKCNYPLYVYKNDYDKNGSIDPVIGQYFQFEGGKKLMPLQTRDDIFMQLPNLKNKYLTYEAFSKVSFKELLGIKDLERETLKSSLFTSSYLENLGDGTFKVIPMPQKCQVAPVNDILVQDFDEDGYLDALLVGNDFTSETHFGRQDAMTGIYLKGDGKGNFTTIESKDSGFYVSGQSHNIAKIRSDKGLEYIIATQTNDNFKVFNIEKAQQ